MSILSTYSFKPNCMRLQLTVLMAAASEDRVAINRTVRTPMSTHLPGQVLALHRTSPAAYLRLPRKHSFFSLNILVQAILSLCQ